MTIQPAKTKLLGIVARFVAASVLLVTATGCHLSLNSSAAKSIPANRLDPALFDCPREDLSPLPYAKLGQPTPDQHVIGAGDVLSVYVFGVFPASEDETPILQRQQATNQRYYPPNGSVVSPATGLPVQVQAGGLIDLPLVDPIQVDGMTMPQAIEAIRAAYRAKDVLKEGRDRITVSLLIPRVIRVVVLREDTPATTVALSSPQAVDQIHRGSGEVIDLPIFQNDVLHAMAATGGLPGTDAARELYVIRAESGLSERFLSGGDLESIVSGGEGGQCNPGVVRIPLVGCPCDPVPFGIEDIVLGQGDVLFIPRRNEYYYTGGLLPGGRVPLPRDEDIDVIEAIAMANGSPGGPLGLDGGVLANGRPGFVREATRVIILRKLADGRQLNIRVDLDRAMHDHKERIRILPDDVLMVHQKPSASILNVTMNWLGGQWVPQSFLVGADD
ncbi:MAG: polysaccharide biosynthesis/export family protein [Planctomycetota bacterium]